MGHSSFIGQMAVTTTSLYFIAVHHIFVYQSLNSIMFSSLFRAFHQYMVPSNVLSLSRKVSVITMICSIPILAFSFGWALLFSPADVVQGYSVRILYIHVPSAYMATLGYAVLAVLGCCYMVTRSIVVDLLMRALAPVGLTFAIVCLATGSIWGKPTWGVYWVWDARLTSVLLLLFLYLGQVLFAAAYRQTGSGGSYAIAVLSVVGAVNLPIIRFSVEWWNTLHQPASLLRLDGPTIHGDMLWMLLLSMFGVTLYTIWMTSSRFEILLLEKTVTAHKLEANGKEQTC